MSPHILKSYAYPYRHVFFREKKYRETRLVLPYKLGN